MLRQMTTQRVMFITLFALIFVLAVRIPLDTDTWWHIRSGEHTLMEGFIYEDPFSFTKAGEEWVNHSWGAQLIIYGAYQLAGDVGLAIYTAFLATAGIAFMYAMSSGNVYLRALALIFGAATAAVFWSPRPQMVSFLFSAIILYILFLYKRKEIDRLWLIPPLMVVWGNMHAGFSIGYIFIGGTIAGEILGNLFNRDGEHVISLGRLRKLIVVTLVSVPLLVINPYTVDILLVPFQTVSIGALREFIQEWNSPNFQERQTWPFVFLLVGILGAVGASQKRLDWTDFVLVSGTAFMGLLAGRNLAVFAVAATPVLTHHVDAILTERGWQFKPMQRVKPFQGAVNLAVLIVILLGGLVSIIGVLNTETVEEAQRQFLPVQVAEFIEAEQPTGPMFNSYNWGGYLMFALPEYPVYVDGRTDLYKNDFLLRYLQTTIGRDGWQDNLDEDGVNMVVIEQNSIMAQNLEQEPGWTQIYPNSDYDEDEIASVFIRESEVASR